MFRFCRKKYYYYDGKFVSLYAAINSGSASKEEQSRYKILKSLDLLLKSFNEVFSTKEVNLSIPSYAPIDRSEPCKICGELTMSTKLVKLENGQLVCIPCSNKNIAEKGGYPLVSRNGMLAVCKKKFPIRYLASITRALPTHEDCSFIVYWNMRCKLTSTSLTREEWIPPFAE
jgi:hypothetical protein